jgi:CheY-like chemotaxis protein
MIKMDRPLSGRRLLVVEDEMMILMLMEDILADLGCESVTVAANVKQALALVNAQLFDAAMLDVNLNGDKSFPIADALVAQGVPFVFATGYGIDALTDNYRDRPLLAKPYSRKDVEEILENLLTNLTFRPELGPLAPA